LSLQPMIASALLLPQNMVWVQDIDRNW